MGYLDQEPSFSYASAPLHFGLELKGQGQRSDDWVEHPVKSAVSRLTTFQTNSQPGRQARGAETRQKTVSTAPPTPPGGERNVPDPRSVPCC